ncbi:hypothetical protein, partial [Halioxenophilus aromaticivorans]|uniref:hypothetical protein n=1 Tax=Halioxenophilus aromaticivorans TaxID=1306992 RepID=UPI0031EF271D
AAQLIKLHDASSLRGTGSIRQISHRGSGINLGERSGEIAAQQKAQVLANQQAQAAYSYQDRLNDYNRAFSACMEARDYSVR